MKKRLFAILSLFALLFTCALAALPAAAEDTDVPEAPKPVYYPKGTVLLNETLLTAAEDFSKNFRVGFGEATYEWNAENGRVRFAATKNTVLDIEALPEGLDFYTISADLYLTESTFNGAVLLGMGINTADKWSRGTYFQMNIPSSGEGDVLMYVNNYDAEGKNVNGGGSTTKKVYEAGYTIGVSKVNVTIKVGLDFVRFYFDGNQIFMIAKEHLTYPSAKPFFILRQNSTLEIDNLTVWSGTGDADPGKVIGDVDPIPEPDTEAPPVTDAPTDAPTQAPTEAPTTAPEQPSENPTGSQETPAGETTGAAEKPSAGCASGVIGVLPILFIAAGATVLAKRKEER